MSTKKHFVLLAQAIGVWAIFWVGGLPQYYQQYSQLTLAVGSILISVGISLAAVAVLQRCRPETRLNRAWWLSFYYTVPFALLDTLYCGLYLGRGTAFLSEYWYLTIFYVTPWLTFIPTALIIGKQKAGSP